MQSYGNMPEHNIMTAKCCCCSLRTGSIIVAIFSLVVALIFMGLAAAASSSLGKPSCHITCVNSKCSEKCIPSGGARKMLSNILAILAVTNALEVVMSIGLIWGASRRILSWVTGWLLVTASWILLHCSVALSFLFAASAPEAVVLVSVLGTIILGLAILALLTNLHLRNEMSNAALILTIDDSPTTLLSNA